MLQDLLTNSYTGDRCACPHARAALYAQTPLSPCDLRGGFRPPRAQGLGRVVHAFASPAFQSPLIACAKSGDRNPAWQPTTDAELVRPAGSPFPLLPQRDLADSFRAHTKRQEVLPDSP